MQRLDFVFVAFALTACMGRIEGGATPSKPTCSPTGTMPPTSMLRLTRAQLDNVIHSLVRTKVVPSAVLSLDEKEGPFAVNAVTLVSRDLAEQYQFIAEAIGDEIEADVQAHAPCAGAATASVAEACAHSLIADFGRRAYRRPLSAEDAQRWLRLYQLEAASGGYASGVRAVVEGMLQSPNMLYRVEPLPSGVDAATSQVYALDSYALATRLSFLVWNSGPDDALLTAAANDELKTDVQRTAVVDRLLADSRARDTSAAFTEAWAGIEGLLAQASSPARMREVDPALVPLMRDETISLVDDVLRVGNGTLSQVFTSTRGRLDPALARSIYQVTTAPDDAGFFTMPDGQRSGLLSQASVMFTHAHSEQTSPVLRGRWLRESLFCQPVPDPPPGVVAVPPAPVPGQTTRERSMVHRTNISCSACHQLLDDTGFGFETFDQFGRYRSLDSGKPVDDTGELIGTDVDGPFKGVTELGQRLSSSRMASQCFARQWFRYGLGRIDGAHDACTVEDMAAGAHDVSFSALLHRLVVSDAFTSRRAQ